MWQEKRSIELLPTEKTGLLFWQRWLEIMISPKEYESPRFTMRGITALPPQAMRQKTHEEHEWSDRREWNENSAF